MNYVNRDHFRDENQDDPVFQTYGPVRPAQHNASADTARQVAALLGRCLPIPDTPELSYLRCFVTLAFEEASIISNRSAPSKAEIDYIAFLEEEAKSYGRSPR